MILYDIIEEEQEEREARNGQLTGSPRTEAESYQKARKQHKIHNQQINKTTK